MKRLMAVMVLAVGLTVMAGEKKPSWSAGALEASGEKKITTEVKVKPCGEGISKFTLKFGNERSGDGYVQFPLRAKEEFTAIEFEAQADMDAEAEVWLSDGKNWELQETIKFREGRRKIFVIAVKKISCVQCQWFRLTFPRQKNPEVVEILLMQPHFVR